MTARYQRVSPNYWMLAKGWDPKTTVTGLYVQTCRHRVTEGLYHLPKEYIAADLGYTPAVVSRALGTLTNAGLVKYDERGGVLLLLAALEMQVPTTEKQIQGAVDRIRMVPGSPLLWDLYCLARRHANGLADALANCFPELAARNGSGPFESSNPRSRSELS